jgi:hypothetical protein
MVLVLEVYTYSVGADTAFQMLGLISVQTPDTVSRRTEMEISRVALCAVSENTTLGSLLRTC